MVAVIAIKNKKKEDTIMEGVLIPKENSDLYSTHHLLYTQTRKRLTTGTN